MARLIDLSHDVTDGMITYPGLPAPRMSTFLSRQASAGRYAEGTTFDIGMVELCTNTGTYLDVPFHRFADGHDLTGLDLDRCANLAATVVPVTSHVAIEPHVLGDLDLEGQAVLFHTGWSQHWGSERYLSNDHPYLTEATVDALIEGGVTMVGIDSLNIDDTVGGERPAHTKLLAAAVPIVEHLTNLDRVPITGARFSAVPPKLAGLGTFTVRAFAIVDDDLDSVRPAVCEVVFDCHDPGALAAFWGVVLGGQRRIRSDLWATVRDPRPGGMLLGFQRVPESKQVKNRVHVDIWSDDIEGDVDRLVAVGATRVGDVVADATGAFQVLLDPEGNEFCLVR
jgi:arylformamidase